MPISDAHYICWCFLAMISFWLSRISSTMSIMVKTVAAIVQMWVSLALIAVAADLSFVRDLLFRHDRFFFFGRTTFRFTTSLKFSISPFEDKHVFVSSYDRQVSRQHLSRNPSPCSFRKSSIQLTSNESKDLLPPRAVLPPPQLRRRVTIIPYLSTTFDSRLFGTLFETSGRESLYRNSLILDRLKLETSSTTQSRARATQDPLHKPSEVTTPNATPVALWLRPCIFVEIHANRKCFAC